MKILKIHTLEKGYADPREVVLHACFQCVENMINEDMFKNIDWTWDEYHRDFYKELIALHEWWTVTRPARVDPLDCVVGRPEFNFDEHKKDPNVPWMRFKSDEEAKAWREACLISDAWEESCNKEDDEMLHRLVNIRLGMWT